MKTFIGKDSYVQLHTVRMSTRDLVKEHATLSEREGSDNHVFLCDLGDIINKYQQWVRWMPRVKPFYAVKCNGEFPVLKMLADIGASFDCASKIEIKNVLDLGVSPERIIYAHPCKQLSMLSFAKQHGVRMMTVDNVEELYKVKTVYPTARLVLRIVIISEFKGKCDFSRKYGCHPADAKNLLQTAKDLGLNVIGISFHVGTNCQDHRPFSVAIQQAREVFNMGTELGFAMDLLDIGGGFPGQQDTGDTFLEISRVVNKTLQHYFPVDEGVEIIAEPGRYMVSSAAIVAVSIIAKRVVPRSRYENDRGDVEIAAHDDTHRDENVVGDVEIAAHDDTHRYENVVGDVEIAAHDDTHRDENVVGDVEIAAHDDTHRDENVAGDVEIAAHDDTHRDENVVGDVEITAHDDTHRDENVVGDVEIATYDDTHRDENVVGDVEIATYDDTHRDENVVGDVEIAAHDDTHRDENVTMYYVNDGMYGSFMCKLLEKGMYEAICVKDTENAELYESCIWGPSCDSRDVIVESTRLPSHEIGEWFYFRDMGAYTLSLATKFNEMEGPKRIYYCQADVWYQVYTAEKSPTNGNISEK